MVDDSQRQNEDTNEQIGDYHCTIVETDEKALVRAVNKWLHFQKAVWQKIYDEMIKPSKRLARWAIILRLMIIILSASVTTLSGLLPENYQPIVTTLAGVLTALTGIEAYFKFSERISQNKLQQRELENMRDELRYRWFINVEIETDMQKKIEYAKMLLEEGPKKYNEILNNFAVKTEETGAPYVTEPPAMA